MSERLILVTNDDGYNTPGIEALIAVASKFGHVVGVAPREPQSGKGHSITTYEPLFPDMIYRYPEAELYSLTGTPVDCVKYALDHLLLGRQVDLVLSGINHGSNSGVNVLYSGTMGAAIEGALYAAPSIGFSHINHSHECDLTATIHYAEKIIAQVLEMPHKVGVEQICLNVNVPDLPLDQIKGVRVTRQNRGYWLEEFFARKDPRGKEYFWLTGDFVNYEPAATDTDAAAIADGYVAIVPVQVDLTDYARMDMVKEYIK